MAALWVFVLVSSSALVAFCRATTASTDDDAMSLLGFKDSISLDPGGFFSSWNVSASHHCAWRGVTCDEGRSGRVVGLSLAGDGGGDGSLVGTLSAAIGNLTALRVLSIPHNVFSGEIPGSLRRLRLLELLELQGNNFSGQVPDQISYFRSLRVLNLSFNSFSGSIPKGLVGFGRIRAVDLSNNRLSGELKLDGFSSCASLYHLKLSKNFLVSSIPPEIGKCRNLRTLLLDGNNLEGKIPAEIGRIEELRVLDLSRNSLTDRVPKELGNCKKLSVLVLTNLTGFDAVDGGSAGEFNAFEWGVPWEVLLLPSLQVLWAPRANLAGRLPGNRNSSCSLRVLNLGQNYITGAVPESLGMCKNLTFLDLSSNNLLGYFPKSLQVRCMVYFNISRNNITGALPSFGGGVCEQNGRFLDMEEDLQNAYTSIVPFLGQSGLMLDADFSVVHDFSWNCFAGSLPSFSVGDELLGGGGDLKYRLLLNNNRFKGSLLGELVSGCDNLSSFSVNLSMNQLSGEFHPQLILNCLCLTEFEAAHNQIEGSISPEIGNLRILQRLDLSGNKLFGSLPDQLGKLRTVKWVLLGGNNLTGQIPFQLGELASLMVLDLSQNALTGSIPASLTNDSVLETLLLNDNKLSGEIPLSFSNLSGLTTLDLSFNNLSGHIPYLQHLLSCQSFRGNKYLHSCPDSDSPSPAALPVPLEVQKLGNKRKLKSIIIASVTSVSVVLVVLLSMVVVIIGRRKFGRVSTRKGKVVVTFADTPTELNYENVVRATSNFSIRNLIGTGGFGSTYKAELVPGYLVAVKRLSLCRFQGIQQFDAEIRTLGRVRHKNLVTLIGYYGGDAEMFLVYNYLSGGNLETFIHEKSGRNVQWPVIHKIAVDIAQALAYLHYSCVPRIVHRDIKPSNILLDEELNAYLSDFGLARLLEVSETHATTDVAGTFGYVAPEYATTCRVSDKSDVYSFGVVLLELMSGKKSLDPSFSEYGNGFNIVSWAKMLIREGRAAELFRVELWDAGPKENLLEMLRLASSCTVESLSVRPSTKQVLGKLKQLKFYS